MTEPNQDSTPRAEVLVSDYAWALRVISVQSPMARSICKQVQALAQNRADAMTEDDGRTPNG